MDKTAFLIKIAGSRNGQALTPQALDVDEWIALLEHSKNLLYPEGKKGRGQVGMLIEPKGVNMKLFADKSVVIQAQDLLSQASATGQMGILHPKQVDAIEHFQAMAEQYHFLFKMGWVESSAPALSLNRHTHWDKTESSWLAAEKYISGIVTNAGGKSNPNIHLDTDELGLLTIAVSHDMLKADDKNRLYKVQKVRILIDQGQHSSEFNKKTAKLLEFVDDDTQGETPDEYLDRLTRQAASDWKKIKNPESWLRELRGYE